MLILLEKTNMVNLISMKPMINYLLHLKFKDWVEGFAVLSYLKGKSLFSLWCKEEEIKKVYFSDKESELLT